MDQIAQSLAKTVLEFVPAPKANVFLGLMAGYLTPNSSAQERAVLCEAMAYIDELSGQSIVTKAEEESEDA